MFNLFTYRVDSECECVILYDDGQIMEIWDFDVIREVESVTDFLRDIIDQGYEESLI